MGFDEKRGRYNLVSWNSKTEFIIPALISIQSFCPSRETLPGPDDDGRVVSSLFLADTVWNHGDRDVCRHCSNSA